MKTFFQDEYINTKILSRLTREIRKNELDRTIEELGSLNKIQSKVLSRCDFMTSEKKEPEFVKKIDNARRKNV
ncbi:hypothetical protein IJ425_08660 [bacterium]|nr:hypothetical protein [bacterium]